MMSNKHRILVGTVGEGVFASDDGGQSFVRKSRGMFVECDVRALAAHPQEGNIIYAGTNEGLYRTLDCGENWTRLDSSMNNMVIWSVLLDARHPETICVGTRPAHVFRSTDSGTSWVELGTDIPRDCAGLIFNRVTTLIPDPSDSDTLWMGVEIGGVHVSRDLGESWNPRNEFLSSLDIHGLVIVPGDRGARRILATTNNGLNISEDGGQTWRPQPMRGKFSRPYFRGIVQNADDRSMLLMGNGDGPPGSVGAIWRSTDGGSSWCEANLPCAPNSTIWGFARHRLDARQLLAHSVSGELYMTLDGGNNWVKMAHEFGEIRAILWG